MILLLFPLISESMLSCVWKVTGHRHYQHLVQLISTFWHWCRFSVLHCSASTHKLQNQKQFWNFLAECSHWHNCEWQQLSLELENIFIGFYWHYLPFVMLKKNAHVLYCGQQRFYKSIIFNPATKKIQLIRSWKTFNWEASLWPAAPASLHVATFLHRRLWSLEAWVCQQQKAERQHRCNLSLIHFLF